MAKKKAPKYNVGDVVKYKYKFADNGEEGTMRVDEIEKDEYGRYVYYSVESENARSFLYEEDITGKVDIDQDEYQEYLRLKEKYGNL